MKKSRNEMKRNNLNLNPPCFPTPFSSHTKIHPKFSNQNGIAGEAASRSGGFGSRFWRYFRYGVAALMTAIERTENQASIT
jgi:hypothetical protein